MQRPRFSRSLLGRCGRNRASSPRPGGEVSIPARRENALKVEAIHLIPAFDKWWRLPPKDCDIGYPLAVVVV
jgi:hypothetical protein